MREETGVFLQAGEAIGSTGTSRLPIPTGALVAVVGPSGAGKDSLISGVRAGFAARDDVLFVRRAITRPADAGGEEHEPMDRESFERARRAGAFAVTWEAHGLCYGVPVSVDAHLEEGRVAVLNGSRQALPLLRARYANCVVVGVTARHDLLAARLALRGRESEQEILDRLARQGSGSVALPEDALIIDNSGAIADGIGRLAGIIRSAIREAAGADAP